MIERPAARYGRQRLTRRQRRMDRRRADGAGPGRRGDDRGHRVGAVRQCGVKGELGGYRLVDDETVDVTISVTRDDPSQPVVCIVRARSIDGSETGRREVLVPPSAQKTVQVTTAVKSSKPPVVGDVYGCGTDVPSYLVSP